MSDEAYVIPNYLQHRLAGRDVVDLSMGGYGLDQIYLMYRETHRLVADPIVLVGVLVSDDLDRTVLTMRTSTKPYFVVGATGVLSLEGVPITQQTAAECHRAPLKINSYLAALVKRKLFPDEEEQVTARKTAINAKLLEAFTQDDAAPTFVLFYNRQDIGREDWRERFMKTTLPVRPPLDRHKANAPCATRPGRALRPGRAP
jgi:hypothetical protein